MYLYHKVAFVRRMVPNFMECQTKRNQCTAQSISFRAKTPQSRCRVQLYKTTQEASDSYITRRHGNSTMVTQTKLSASDLHHVTRHNWKIWDRRRIGPWSFTLRGKYTWNFEIVRQVLIVFIILYISTNKVLFISALIQLTSAKNCYIQ